MTTKPGTAGRVTKSIAVQTDAPGAENLRLGVTFEVTVPITVSPAHRIYLNTVEGSARTERVRLHRADGEALEARLGATALPPGVRAEVLPVDDEPGASSGDRWLSVTVDAAADVSEHNGFVSLATNHPDAPELRVPLVVRVRPIIDVRPSPVRLWPADGGPDRSTTLVRLGHGGRIAFEITGIEVVDPDLIRAEAVSQGAQQIHSIRVSLADGYSGDGSAARTLVRISTSDRTRPTVELPVDILARNRDLRRPAGEAATTGPATSAGPSGE